MKNNIIFTWMPWSWKTTLGRRLSFEIWYNFVVPEFDLNIKNSKQERNRQKRIIFKEFMDFYRKNKLWN